jgi:hypothetical protein
VALVTVKKYMVPAVVVALPGSVIISVRAVPAISVPTIVTVLPLSPVPAVVAVRILAPPEANEVFAKVKVAVGRAATAMKVAEADTSSLTEMAFTFVTFDMGYTTSS